MSKQVSGELVFQIENEGINDGNNEAPWFNVYILNDNYYIRVSGVRVSNPEFNQLRNYLFDILGQEVVGRGIYPINTNQAERFTTRAAILGVRYGI
jgi:hypothetical protein